MGNFLDMSRKQIHRCKLVLVVQNHIGPEIKHVLEYVGVRTCGALALCRNEVTLLGGVQPKSREGEGDLGT